MIARENPFRTERVLRVRYRLQGETWEELLGRFEGLNRRAALVGAKGSGKTTLLEDLVPRLRDRGFRVKELRLTEESPRFEPAFLDGLFGTLGAGDLLLLDGAEQMGRREWRRFENRSRAGAGLIVTSHRPGLLPTLLTCTTSPELLEELAAELLDGRAAPWKPLLDDLYRRHRGNLREAIRSLYDVFAGVRA